MSGLGGLVSLTTLPQKVLFGGLSVALLAAGTFNVIQTVENRRLLNESVVLKARIDNPKTGYVVRLTQAETNATICRGAIERQNVALRSRSSRDAALIAQVQAQYDTEHAARMRAERSAAAFLAHKPQGETVGERVADIDAQILGDLK